MKPTVTFEELDAEALVYPSTNYIKDSAGKLFDVCTRVKYRLPQYLMYFYSDRRSLRRSTIGLRNDMRWSYTAYSALTREPLAIHNYKGINFIYNKLPKSINANNQTASPGLHPCCGLLQCWCILTVRPQLRLPWRRNAWTNDELMRDDRMEEVRTPWELSCHWKKQILFLCALDIWFQEFNSLYYHRPLQP